MKIIIYICLIVFLITMLYEIITDAIYVSIIIYYSKIKKNPKKADAIMDFLMKQRLG